LHQIDMTAPCTSSCY